MPRGLGARCVVKTGQGRAQLVGQGRRALGLMVEVDEHAACFGAEPAPLFDPLPHDDGGVAQPLHAATDACLFSEEEEPGECFTC